MIRGILVQPSAKRSLIDEILQFTSVETGGVLCGHYQDEYVVIEAASGPGPKAFHSEIEFIMDKEFMHAYLDTEYSDSVGLNIFVGEWHSHPQIYPHPSPQDVQSIFERSYEWTHGDIVFLIVGFVGVTASKLEKQLICLTVDKTDGQIWQIPVAYL